MTAYDNFKDKKMQAKRELALRSNLTGGLQKNFEAIKEERHDADDLDLIKHSKSELVENSEENAVKHSKTSSAETAYA